MLKERAVHFHGSAADCQVGLRGSAVNIAARKLQRPAVTVSRRGEGAAGHDDVAGDRCPGAAECANFCLVLNGEFSVERDACRQQAHLGAINDAAGQFAFSGNGQDAFIVVAYKNPFGKASAVF